MTYSDPKLPDPGPGHNPPRYENRDTYNMSPGAIISMVFAAAVMVGILAFAMTMPSTTASNPAPTTTGQGAPSVNPPASPMVPAPAAPRTTIPAIDQNVPAEKIAPPMPTEPRKNN